MHGTRRSRGEGELEQQWFTEHRYAVSYICQQWLRCVAMPEDFTGNIGLAVFYMLPSKHYTSILGLDNPLTQEKGMSKACDFPGCRMMAGGGGVNNLHLGTGNLNLGATDVGQFNGNRGMPGSRQQPQQNRKFLSGFPSEPSCQKDPPTTVNALGQVVSFIGEKVFLPQ